MKKYIVLVVLLILAIIGYNYIYQDHRNIEKEEASYTLTSNDLISEFKNNSSEAESKYLDQTIEIKGEVTELNANDLTLDNAVFCTFSQIDNVVVGDIVVLKGRCIGFDDLLEEVKMDQCVKIED